jgi:tripartite motif-containing protein 71
MRAVARLAMIILVFGAVTFMFAGTAFAFTMGSSLIAGSDTSSLSESPLVTSGSPVEGEQRQGQEQARFTSPEAVVEREVSRTKYENLSPEGAVKVASEVFPAVVDEPAGGPPRLPVGASIAHFLTDDLAQLDLGAGRHGAIESTVPIAIETSPGTRVPVDLGLSEVGAAFEPKTPLVGVRIPKRLGEGVSLAGTGVSLTPVDAQGSPLAGSEGVLDGVSAYFANTQKDSDIIVKASTFGFETDTLLRSIESPDQLSFRVGLPEGASLVQAEGQSGAVQVVKEGVTLARISAPSAVDAVGRPVPISMDVSEDVIKLTVEDQSGEFEFPIDVDPTVRDWEFEPYEGYPTGWYFSTTNPTGKKFEGYWEKGEWHEVIRHDHGEDEFGGLFYTTKNASQITRSYADGSWNDTGFNVANIMILETQKAPYTEDYDLLPVNTSEGHVSGGYACSPELKCLETTAGSAPPENSNTAGYGQNTTGPGNAEESYTVNTLREAYVEIFQEKGPEASFNKTSKTIYNSQTGEYIPNVLYGSGGWLGPHSGSFEVDTKDPGVGISLYNLMTTGWHDWKSPYGTSECLGIECPEYIDQGYNYKVGMPNGEDKFEGHVEDGVGFYTSFGPQTIKVDAAPPHGIKIVGFQNGNELPQGEARIKVEATDGEGTTKSSGIKSITVSVDGHAVEGTSAFCSEGPCTASTEFTLAARDYSTGQHTFVVTTTDNADNVAQEEFIFRVRGASPVSVGPGSVDPSTGQLTLNATDVSLGGTTGVSRTYQSRDLTAGVEGPLGPQWAINLGGGEGLTVAASGNAVLTASGGASTPFTLNTKKEFESPTGDSNLKLEAKEKVPGKGISEYVLSDAIGGTKTIFEQPASAQSTPPAFVNTFGGEAGQLKQPVSDAIDPSGNVWTVNFETDLVEKFSPTGVLLGSYGSQGTAEGQFIKPWGIGIDPRNGDVYVSDQANNRVEELSPTGAFIRMFGWGVSNNKAEFEICTKECKPGIAGSGNGQFYVMAGVSVDSSGNVWIADYGNSRIEEFNEKGEYVKKFGTAGKGAEQFEGPLSIAFSGGNLYITDFHNNRVQEFSTAGVRIGGFGEAGSESENGKFSGPYGIASDPRTGNLYVVDSGHARVQEFSATGSFITKFGSSGAGAGQFTTPTGIAVNSSGNVYVVDYGANDVDEWMRPLWLPAEAGGPLATSTTTYAYTTVEEEGKAVIRPSEALAPLPAGVSSCTPLVRGCRALTFQYAKETTAKGSNSSEWGEYKGRLVQVDFTAWNTAKGAMSEPIPVAQYSYDIKGRLRAEWDPRLEHALKTIYGYDTEGHVTSLASSGHEPWILTYGTIAGDSNTGRLLKVTRPAASTELWKGSLPENTELPKLSGSFVVGTTVGVSNGKWSNSPAAYSYQWEDCTRTEVIKGAYVYKCKPILGATNANYKLQASDLEYFITVKVTALNGGGTEVAHTEASARVQSTGEHIEGEHHSPGPGATIEYDVPVSGSSAPYSLTKEEVAKWDQKDDPVEGTAIFPPDEPQGWPASDYKRATIEYWDINGRRVNIATPTGGISTNEYNEANEVTRTLSADNRATALKEGSKSAEISEKLDTKTEYNTENTQILKVVRPEHKVKLSTGTEVQARAVTHDYYNEGAKEAEEKNKETYDLLTKSTSGALLSSGEEKDVRTTTMSYNGQKDLGWKLRKPTSVTTDPAGLDLIKTTVYEENSKEESTGNVVETKAPAGTSEEVFPPVFSAHFGGSGSGNGQFNQPWGVALDSSENVWAVDSGNDRVEKFSSSGSFIGAYGKEGTGASEFKEPAGITVNQSTHNVYVADKENNRIDELNSSGGFVETIGWGVSDGKSELEVCKASCKAGISGSGNGQFNSPGAVAIDSHGELLIADQGNDRIEVLSEAGSYISQFGSKGSGNGQFSEPIGLVISEGSLYVVDEGNDRIEQLSLSGSYIGQFGSKGSGSGQMDEPDCITANPSTGTLYVCDYGNERMEEFSPAGKFLTEWGTWGSTHPQSFPADAAVGATGKLYIIDPWADEVGTWIPPEAGAARLNYSTQFGSKGAGNGQFTEPTDTAIDGKGNLWSTDSADNRIEELSSQGSFIAVYGKYGSGEAQFNRPTGIVINKSTGNAYVADTGNNRIEELSSTGTYIASFGTSGSGTLKGPTGIAIDTAGNVWVADCGNNRIVEFSSTGTYIAAYGKEGTGEVQFKGPVALAFSGENVYVADSANHRVEELTNKGAYVRAIGFEGDGSGEFWTPEGITTDAAGNLYVVDNNADHVEEFSPNGSYKATFASPGSGEGQLTQPGGDSIDPAGDLYITDTGNDRIEKWANNNQAVHDTQTIYYTPKTEATVPACQNHPEWANLPCQTQPAAQPESGLPELPVTTMTYNIWDEVETATEKFGSTTRTKTQTYDSAGRALTSEETSSPATDTALPKVTNEYNTETGALEKQSTTTEGKTKAITSKDNTLGQLVKYTDAAGSTTTYSYEEGGDDRLVEISIGGVEGEKEKVKGYQTFAYDPTTGFLTKLVDSSEPGMDFTATYDLEGKMLSETYPNGMTATDTYNQTGTATGIEYVKNTHCATKCPEIWYSDSIMPSIHGETLAQTSTLSKENYTFDNDERLIQTQETPVSEGCTTRAYTYDEESNRKSLTTTKPNSKGECSTEGATVERHTYDAANRLNDENVSYEIFGNTTKLPATDAGGSEGGHELKSTYYLDNQVFTQEQNGETLEYLYDPIGRTLETKSKGKTTSAVISHYSGPGEALTWTSEGSEKGTRNIPGIDGALDAIQTNSGAPILQLHDLQGDIVATAAYNETETKLLSAYNSTEFGVPKAGTTPPKYAWLGASGIATEQSLSSGISTQGGASYVPLIGRPLQTQPIASPGSFPDGTGGIGVTQATYLQTALSQLKGTLIEHEAEREGAKKRETEERASMEACPASECHVDGPGEGNCEVNCLTVIGGGGAFAEPSEAEWIASEETFDRDEGIMGAHTASVRSEFENWVKAVAHGASAAGEYLYDHSTFYFPEQVKQAKSSWHFFVELFSLGSYTELGLQCAKGGNEEAFEVGEAEPPPVNEVLVPVGAVLGCISGVLGG